MRMRGRGKENRGERKGEGREEGKGKGGGREGGRWGGRRGGRREGGRRKGTGRGGELETALADGQGSQCLPAQSEGSTKPMCCRLLSPAALATGFPVSNSLKTEKTGPVCSEYGWGFATSALGTWEASRLPQHRRPG